MNHKLIVLYIAFLFSFISTVFANQTTISNMIFFGDSLSDVGNNTWILMDGEIGAPIANPNNQNRKYLWVNYLTDDMFNKSVYPSNQLNLFPSMDNVSYAYASADTSNDYLNADWPQTNPPVPFVNQNCTQPGLIKDAVGNIISTCVPGLLKQVDSYLNAVQHNPYSGSLFFIWAGANDLLNYYTAYMNHSFIEKLFVERFNLPSNEALDKVEQQAVDNILMAKRKLIDAGIKPEKIYILTLPNLSKTPAVQSNNSWALKLFYGKEKLEKSLSDMSKNFNRKLQGQQDELKYILPVSHYIRIDNLLDDVISNPSKYQLTNVTESCVDKKVTPACDGYLFYNAKHPTTFVNKMIAEVVLSIIKKSECS